MGKKEAQDSCSRQCGKMLGKCSCQVTCKSLGDCCPDYREFCLQISPYSGSLMGGKDFEILNVTFNASSDVRCRFKQEIQISGYVAQDGQAHCISPLLYETGFIPFEVSRDNGLTFPYSGNWLSVHHSKVSAVEKCTLVNATKWQYYGTPNTGGTLTVTWMNQTLPTRRVNIEVWGYQETGQTYSETWMAEWKYLYTLGREKPNSGTFTFTPVPAQANYSSWEVGALRISPSRYSDGQSNIPALWSSEHALAWHLGEDFRKDATAWATDKCLKWDLEEERLPNFLEEVADCPCTLAQARADTGRFHTDYGCDIEKGSECTYHPGAVHCVRGIQASPQYASGQQCCYDSTGTQVLTGDSTGGSTPDRGHDWGSPPFKRPPRIPGLSHWLYDVISFYYCCLWSGNCHLYMKRRPSSDCRTYRPPRAASAFGDPHFLTFDGLNFTFKGHGEYTLVESNLTSLRVQGRTQPTRLPNSKLVRQTAVLTKAILGLDGGTFLWPVYNGVVVADSHTCAISLSVPGLFLYSAAGQNVTVMFSSGAGVEVTARGGFLSPTVLLPEKFMNQTRGLLGVMNDNPGDEYTFRNGTTMPLDASPQQLFAFGADWAVGNETSLFTYDTQFLLNTFFYGPKHNSSFLPIRAAPGQRTQHPLSLQLPATIQDVGTPEDLEQLSLPLVVSCGWLDHPTKGRKEGTNYLMGSTIRFSCDQGYSLAGSEERTCQLTGAWSGNAASCLPSTDNHQAILFGSIFGVLGFLILAVLIFLLYRKRKRANRSPNAPESVPGEKELMPVRGTHL
ncbi:sushi domain-containing protein 2-like [Alligator sinensis]|uniref:Sushi domain-containing protein 2-like n=1 Tax=Alligator sinensis TaxID=38654 RepID=A0A3Q0G8F2_ALLSI|nr:sushi domain-containing protein 2-like [Alligator sinensis]